VEATGTAATPMGNVDAIDQVKSFDSLGKAAETMRAMSALAARLLSRSFGSQVSDQFFVFFSSQRMTHGRSPYARLGKNAKRLLQLKEHVTNQVNAYKDYWLTVQREEDFQQSDDC
jgi:hypothetical protein